ncbi:hypothetical protein HDU91_001958, partial [Kappamyces sp. JEL0680]
MQLTVALIAAAYAAPALRVKSHVPTPPEWTYLEPASAQDTMTLHIALKQENMDKLHQELLSVSDPSSPRYRQHLSKEQVDRIVLPSEATVQKVAAWLGKNGISSFQRSANFITIPSIQVTKAQEMLGTQYARFKHASAGTTLVRAVSSYSLPSDIFDAVEMVAPTLFFGNMHAGPRPQPPTEAVPTTEAALAGCSSSSITPACLRTLYNIGSYTASNPKNSIGITGYLEQYAAASDLASYVAKYNNNAGKGGSFKT